MRRRALLVGAVVLVFAVTAHLNAQTARTDVIWARKAANPITLDGKMNESDWAKADSVVIQYGNTKGLPGSGYNTDGWTVPPTDPVNAVAKFLVYGDSLYIGITCKDSSIGGGQWPGPAMWDGMLGAIFDKSTSDRPIARREIYYGWVATDWADPTLNQPGKLPGFFGAYGGSRTDTITDPNMPQYGMLKGQVWDAKTFVKGTTNDDSKIDTSWTTEFKFNLKAFGYDPENAKGDIVGWSTSIYDADWQWYADSADMHFNVSKAWEQGQWGGGGYGDSYDYLRIFIRPDVTTSSGADPSVAPDVVIPSAGNYAASKFDGTLDDPVWSNSGIGMFKLKYGDDAIRNAYPQDISYTSGQEQQSVNGAQNALFDVNDATVKYFYKGDTLYFGFDVNDGVVESVPSNPALWDGFRVTIDDRGVRNGDSVQATRNLTFIVDSVGGAMRMEDLSKTGWDSTAGAVQVKLALKSGTTVDTMGTDVDKGYTAEMKINLRKLGYPAGRGDGVLFFGVTMFDGDVIADQNQDAASQVWFARKQPVKPGAAWAWMDPNTTLSVGQNNAAGAPTEFKLYGNYPNPFNPSTTIKFSISKESNVKLEVFDILGRLVSVQDLGVRKTGIQEAEFNGSNLASGVYTYRLRTPSNQLIGRMMLLK